MVSGFMCNFAGRKMLKNMSEELKTLGEGATKQERWDELLPQIKSLIQGEKDPIARMANVSAAIMETFRFLWVGFYRNLDGVLVLGPFQGPLACTRIRSGKGVCGTAFAEKRTLVVPDVDQFPGHIACSSASRSEIVVPIIAADGSVTGVIDIDSPYLNTFDETDAKALEQVAKLMSNE